MVLRSHETVNESHLSTKTLTLFSSSTWIALLNGSSLPDHIRGQADRVSAWRTEGLGFDPRPRHIKRR